jgi:hypothetical protein
MMEYVRAELVSQLKKGKGRITFMKMDGTERVMECTLQQDLLPDQMDVEEYISERRANDEVLAVWDLEKDAWRSFRLDRVVTVEWL